jgi:hypothetical protein
MLGVIIIYGHKASQKVYRENDCIDAESVPTSSGYFSKMLEFHTGPLESDV